MGLFDDVTKVIKVVKTTSDTVKKAGGVKDAVKGIKVSNSEFNKTRELVERLFDQKPGVPDKWLAPQELKFQVTPHYVPKEKVGSNYQQEFGRLYDAVYEALKGFRSPAVADDFKKNVTRWTNAEHGTDYLATIIKGAGSNKGVDIKQDKYGILVPYLPTMISSLKSKGVAIPTIKGQPLSGPNAMKLGVNENPDIEGVTQLFYNNFVAVKSNYNFDSFEQIDFSMMHPGQAMHLDDAVIDATITYIKSIQDQKNQGKTMPKVLDQMGDQANKVKKNLTKKAKETVAEDVGTKTSMNASAVWLIAGAVILLIVILSSRK
jgi:hypothetical protein